MSKRKRNKMLYNIKVLIKGNQNNIQYEIAEYKPHKIKIHLKEIILKITCLYVCLYKINQNYYNLLCS